MPLLTTDEFRERFDIDPDIASTRIEPHIGSASRRLRAWVGGAVYDAAAAAAVNGQDDDTDVINDLKSAEAHLAFHFGIWGFNAALSSKGAMMTATASEGREVRRYYTPKETAELAEYFLELAREIAGPYIAAGEDAGIAVIDAGCEVSEYQSCRVRIS